MTSLADNVSNLIGLIYEASHDERSLHEAMARTLALTGSHRAMVTRANPGAGEHDLLRWYGNFSSPVVDTLRDYETDMYALDPTFDHVRRNPHGRIYHSVLDPSLDHPAHQDYLRWVGAIGVKAWTLGYAFKPDGSCFGISLHHDPAEACGDSQQRLFAMLFEHIDRAVGMVGKTDVLAGPAARVVIDAKGAVVSVSDAAANLLAAGDGMLVRSGQLVPARVQERSAFERLLGSALRARTTGSAGGAMQVSRPSERRPLHVLVDPLPRREALGAFVDQAIVTLIDPDAAVPERNVNRWRALWGLTPAEARLAATFLETECDLGRTAERLCISSGTARTHLARIFRKTHTRSQPELVRLLTQASG